MRFLLFFFFWWQLCLFSCTLLNFSTDGKIKVDLRSKAQAGKVSAFCHFFQCKGIVVSRTVVH